MIPNLRRYALPLGMALLLVLGVLVLGLSLSGEQQLADASGSMARNEQVAVVDRSSATRLARERDLG